MATSQKFTLTLLILSGYSLCLSGCTTQEANSTPEPELEIASSGPKYKVTPQMAQGAHSRTDTKAFDFEVPLTKNHKLRLSKLVHKGPVVLIAIKDGCPCNLRAQPLFNKLSELHKQHTTFIGILNADQQTTKQYVQDTHARFPIVPDPDLRILSAYQAERSAYTLLVGRGLRIVKAWPGYSADMLKELNTTLSRLTHTPEPFFDPKYAPKEMTAGCSFK
jgi:peroxiredoxin